MPKGMEQVRVTTNHMIFSNVNERVLSRQTLTTSRRVICFFSSSGSVVSFALNKDSSSVLSFTVSRVSFVLDGGLMSAIPSNPMTRYIADMMRNAKGTLSATSSE